jgi:hypothetical protein
MLESSYYNNLTERGNRELAKRIESYWLSRGRVVQCRVEAAVVLAKSTIYGVRSDLGVYLPAVRRETGTP